MHENVRYLSYLRGLTISHLYFTLGCNPDVPDSCPGEGEVCYCSNGGCGCAIDICTYVK